MSAPNPLFDVPLETSAHSMLRSPLHYPSFPRFPMKWTLRTFSLVLGVLILGLGNAAMALQRGDRGSDVTALQTRLTALGCYDSEIIGIFGPSTEAAVKRCQAQFNLTPDGIAGPQTLAALNGTPGSVIEPNPMVRDLPPVREIILQSGDRGQNVADLQQRLQNLGYSTGGVDGIYGQMTAAAVSQFQSAVQLPVDGKFGTKEQAALDSTQPIAMAPVPPSSTVISLAPLTPGTENSNVTRLQQRLKEAGYFQGETTQFYGSRTQQAVTNFQADRGFTATGVADTQTLEALGFRSGTVQSWPPSVSYSRPSNSPFNSQGFTSTRAYPERPVTPNRRYVVVIPKQNGETLGQVRQFVGSAQAYSSGKGEYIAAGTFARRSDAEKRSQNLRAYGLDARVDYQ